MVRLSALPTRRRNGCPHGVSASKRTEAGARRSRTPVRRWTRPSRWIVISARVRRSANSSQRCWRTAIRRWASGERGSRGGGREAHPVDRSAAAPRSAAQRLRLDLGPLTLDAALLVAGLLELLLDLFVLGIQRERLLPGGHRVVHEAVLHVGVAQVVEDHGVFLGALHRALELAKGLGVVPLLVEGPTQAVDEVAVLRLDLEGLLDEDDRLVQVDALLGVHVADVVVRLGVLGVERDHPPEGADRVVAALLLLEI